MTPFLSHTLQQPFVSGGNRPSEPGQTRDQQFIGYLHCFADLFALEVVITQVTHHLKWASSKGDKKV